MAMFVQHNMAAMNANRMLGSITGAAGKTTEKLASGYRINRAADDAAGLAISEKMRGQIRGLNQASTNAQDGISLIQTAEGALAESHSILQRMRELAVQAGNGTETDEDRSNIQDEIAQLQDELDRIAETTEFNTMKLLDGSYSASGATSSTAGPKYGQYDGNLQAFITSNVAGVTVTTDIKATAGGESAHWDATGKNLKLNLAKGVTYTQGQIDELIANATQEDSGAQNAPANVTVKFSTGMYQANAATTSAETVAGTKATTKAKPDAYMASDVTVTTTALQGGEKVTIVTKNKDTDVTFTTTANKEDATITQDDEGNVTITLATGQTYSQADLEKLIKDNNITDFELTTDGSVTVTTTVGVGGTYTTDTVAANKYNVTDALTTSVFDGDDGDKFNVTVETNKYNLNVEFAVSTTVTTDTDEATWDKDANKVTITLAAGEDYKQADIDKLLADMMQKDGNEDLEVKVTLQDGDVTTITTATAAGDGLVASSANPVFDDKVTFDTKDYYGANQIKFTSNKYGADYNITIDIDFTAEAGKEGVTLTGTPEYKKMGATDIADAITSTASYKLSLQAGKEYSAEDIEAILAEAGLDIDVELFGNEKNQGTDGPNTLKIMDKSVTATIEMAGGTGIGDEDAFLGEANYNGSGNAIDGLSLQVGANQGQTISFNIEDMSATALGVSGTNVRVDEQDRAQKSITVIDAAIQKVSKQRSTLGAIQNRLEHTIANLDTSAENLQNAESRIRDTDMAEEMVTFSKNNILQQAAQSMLAQANQSTQGVLSLLG